MRSVKITVRPPGQRTRLGLFGKSVHLFLFFFAPIAYGCINMAVNVQAAPLLYRMLHKQNVSFGFSQCIAVAHGNGKKWQEEGKKQKRGKGGEKKRENHGYNPKKIYMHYIQTHPHKRRESDWPHSPGPLPPSLPSHPVRCGANTRRHDGDAPCVTAPLAESCLPRLSSGPNRSRQASGGIQTPTGTWLQACPAAPGPPPLSPSVAVCVSVSLWEDWARVDLRIMALWC